MKRTPFCLFVLALLTASPLLAQYSGHTNWDGWSFDFEVKDGAGIGLRYVLYNGELLLWKASMPVIRVRYAGDVCGPYADQINTYHLKQISWCGNSYVCQRSYTSGGRTWLEVGVEAQIGQYDLYQVWYLSQDGWFGAHLFSKGLQCNIDHVHHPYWRLDFDINGAPLDQVFVFDNNRPDQGWGPGWMKYTNELNDVKKPATGRVWFARDNPTGHGVWIMPGSNDGTSDSFSSLDIGARLYRYADDQPWPFGAWGELGYNHNDGIQEKDIVFWYVAHLAHAAAQGPNVWHSAGPWIHISR
jgi:hypothetical protein